MSRLGKVWGSLGRTITIVALACIVAAGAVLAAVPASRQLFTQPGQTITATAPGPTGFVLPTSVDPGAAVLQPRETGAAPAGPALITKIPKLSAKVASAAGIVVLDPADGRSLLSRNDRPMIPASTMKLLTARVALEAMPANRTFRTTVVQPKRGQILLVGGGDPLLSNKRRVDGRASLQELADRTVESLRQAGTTSISLGYDASLFSGPGWHPHWGDNYRYSVTTVSALVVDGGRVGGWTRTRTPAADAADTFAGRLRKAGIKVSGPKPGRAPSGAAMVAAVDSLPLDRIVEEVLRESDNDGAEHLLRLIGITGGRKGSFTDGAAEMRSILNRLGLWRKGMVIDDGSGLSRNNRIVPSALSRTMVTLLTDPELRELVHALPVGGVSGTLWNRFDDPNERAGRGVVRAKTGSLRDVSALAGFLITRDGSVLAFALMVNGARSTEAAKDWMERTTARWASCGC